jgi:hypothetical protein
MPGNNEGSEKAQSSEEICRMWSLQPDTVGTFLSCIIDVCLQLESHAIYGILKLEVAFILGYFGPPDIYAVSHTNLPFKAPKSVRYYRGDVNGLKKNIVRSLYSN